MPVSYLCPGAHVASPPATQQTAAANRASSKQRFAGLEPTNRFAPSLKTGDLIGFAGEGLVSGFINLVTFGFPRVNLSHVGIIARHRGRLMLFESDSDTGVTASPIGRRIRDYIGRVLHLPLTRKLYRHEDDRLTEFLTGMLGRDYDTAGAVKAAGWLTAALKAKATKPDLSSLFCSELVAAAHNAVGLFPTPQPGRWSPNSLVRAERLAGLLGPHRRLK